MELDREIRKLMERQRAKDLIRKQQQGLGKPIIEAKVGNQQLVAVGNKVFYSPCWRTFVDFLSDYLKTTIGADWGKRELAKPFEARHLILQWYDKVCRIQQENFDASKEVQSVVPTGAFTCYFGLAYNLYLLEHNVELQKRYVDRLKDPNNFQGAYYELIIANCLIRAGYKLELEDESDDSSKHCEFSAVSLTTKKKYWVEAKMRSVVGIFGKTKDNGTSDRDPTSQLTKHINLAFKKPASDERLIFVDVNAPPTAEPKPEWIERAGLKLDQKEKDLAEGQSAYVFVTNMCFHWDLDRPIPGPAAFAYGLGIPDFAKQGYFSFREIYARKQKHVDGHQIMESLAKYPKLPTTLDGRLPSETFDENPPHVKIGETHLFPNRDGKDVEATVTSAIVVEHERAAYIGTDKGLILKHPLTDKQLQDYKNHPDAFFGAVHPVGKKANSPYELFEHFVETFKTYSREGLLNQVMGWPDRERLSKLPNEELVLVISERLATHASQHSANAPTGPSK